MKQFYIITILFLFFGCSSSKLISDYKNSTIETFEANKVLIIGMTGDQDIRRVFENKVSEAMEKNKVNAVKSVDFFEKSFTNKEQTLEDLNQIEYQLLEAGFDAILLTKVVGKETKVSLTAYYNTYADRFKSFEDYYYGNQYVFFKEEQEHYIVYTTETSLYCICPGKERELLWQGIIDVTKLKNAKKNVNHYIKTLIDNLEEQKLLVSD